MASADSFKIFKATRGNNPVLVIAGIAGVLPFRRCGYAIRELNDELIDLRQSPDPFAAECIQHAIVELGTAGRKPEPFRFLRTCPAPAAVADFYMSYSARATLAKLVLQQ